MNAFKALALTQLFFLLAILVNPLAASENQTNPSSVVLSPFDVISLAANELQVTLSGRQDYFSENPDELFRVIGTKLLPVFDVRYSSYLVLGDHWKTADNQQRDRFVKAFSNFLIISYAKGLLSFNQQDLFIYPGIYSKDKKKAEVKTDLKLGNGDKVPVNYRLRNSIEGWRVYDVRVSGVSYIQNYRSQFNAEISSLGLNSVILRLEKKQESNAPEKEN
jgi:phospholipid transport system substrate-binding protein